ncbi:MAG: YggS family pyridoxal phosphate-dependent enzyme [Thermodesulfobacteriota bacterium]
MIAHNLETIRQRIAEAALRSGRQAEDVRIVAAAKGQGRAKIREALASGLLIVGHNYVQEASEESLTETPQGVEFHMIGHLQKNKAGPAVDLFHVIQTLDDPKLAVALNRRAETAGRTIGVMIQVSLADEPQKSGIPGAEVPQLVEAVRSLDRLRLLGLMTMPPFFDQPERARPFFARLRELRDRLIAAGILAQDMHELSMGMTGDFQVAVEEGATLVRIGTALFGPRA